MAALSARALLLQGMRGRMHRSAAKHMSELGAAPGMLFGMAGLGLGRCHLWVSFLESGGLAYYMPWLWADSMGMYYWS